MDDQLQNTVLFIALWMLIILLMSVLEYLINRALFKRKKFLTAFQFLPACAMIVLTMYRYNWGQAEFRWLVAVFFGLLLGGDSEINQLDPDGRIRNPTGSPGWDRTVIFRKPAQN
jgi:hypothetical protein